MTNPEPQYDVDDRGNIAQFYLGDEIIATLDREAGDHANESTWDGDEDVTAWAEQNGYAYIRDIQKIQ